MRFSSNRLLLTTHFASNSKLSTEFGEGNKKMPTGMPSGRSRHSDCAIIFIVIFQYLGEELGQSKWGESSSLSH
jgi:hypothetical protein